MPRILYGVSPIGLGHATRSLVIIEELRKRGGVVQVFSGGNAAEFFREEGVEVRDCVKDAPPGIANGEMGGVASWYIRSWLAQRGNVKKAKALVEGFAPDVVVCDEEFSGMTAAGETGLKRVFIADELQLGFARSRVASWIEGRVGRWYEGLLGSVDALVIPDFGEDSGNRRYVGPIVRDAKSSCAEVRESLGLPSGPFVLVSLSGSGVGRELASAASAAVRDAFAGETPLVIAGNRGNRVKGPGIYDLGVVKDNQDLVACADLVISTAGKSTIDEAAAAGIPVIAVPIRHHAEQERNARALGYGPDDAKNLPALVREKFGKRSPPQRSEGGARAAELVLSLARA